MMKNNKISVVYCVSSLVNSGPTNQLYYLITDMINKGHSIKIIILSVLKRNSDLERFSKLGVEIIFFNYSNIFFLIKNFLKFKNILKKINPDIVHTQGIRPDIQMFFLRKKFNWVNTSRNIPNIDYPKKYGLLLGNIMSIVHLYVFKKSDNLICCSASMKQEFLKRKIDSKIVKNGTKLNYNLTVSDTQIINSYQRPVFLFAGSLIKRKRILFLTHLMNEFLLKNEGTFFVLGDGEHKEILNERYGRNKKIVLLNYTKNINEYYKYSDYCISASSSEGMPNVALESISCGTPVILSSIDSHNEILRDFPNMTYIFKANNINDSVKEIRVIVDNPKKHTMSQKEVYTISHERMTNQYESIYFNLI